MGLMVIGDGRVRYSAETIFRPVKKVDQTDYTATRLDNQILVTAGGVNRTVSMPSAVGLLGARYTIEKVDAGVGQVIIDPAGAETILGAATYSLVSQFEILTFWSDGANWV